MKKYISKITLSTILFLVLFPYTSHAIYDITPIDFRNLLPSYSTESFQQSSCPYGSEFTPLNLTSTGTKIKIRGRGFGDRNLNDSIPEMLYIPINGELKMVYRGMRNEGVDVYFGLLSWTDNEIIIEVIPGTEKTLGSTIVVRTYTSSSDNQGVCVGGKLIPSFIPHIPKKITSVTF